MCMENAVVIQAKANCLGQAHRVGVQVRAPGRPFSTLAQRIWGKITPTLISHTLDTLVELSQYTLLGATPWTLLSLNRAHVPLLKACVCSKCM